MHAHQPRARLQDPTQPFPSLHLPCFPNPHPQPQGAHLLAAFGFGVCQRALSLLRDIKSQLLPSGSSPTLSPGCSGCVGGCSVHRPPYAEPGCKARRHWALAGWCGKPGLRIEPVSLKELTGFLQLTTSHKAGRLTPQTFVLSAPEASSPTAGAGRAALSLLCLAPGCTARVSASSAPGCARCFSYEDTDCVQGSP